MAPGCFARGRHTHAHTCPLYSRFREDFEGVFCFGVTGFCSPKGREEKPSGREEGKGKEGGRCGYCIWYESIAIRKDFGDSFSDDSDWHRPREDALDTRKRRESVDRCDCRSSLQRYRGNLESNTEGGIGIRLDQLVDTHNLFLVAGEGGKKRRNTPTFCPPSPPPPPSFPPLLLFPYHFPQPQDYVQSPTIQSPHYHYLLHTTATRGLKLSAANLFTPPPPLHRKKSVSLNRFQTRRIPVD